MEWVPIAALLIFLAGLGLVVNSPFHLTAARER